MANEKHLQVVIGGGYTTSGLSTETWQCQVRCALVFGTVDDIGTFPNNWDPVASTIARTETHWTITSNWKINHSPSGTFQPDDYLNDQVAPAVIAWLSTSKISSQVRADWIKVNPIGAPSGDLVPAPPYSTGSPALLTWTSSNPIGGGSGASLPPQNAVVVSHRTNQLGRKGRGRMFLPAHTADALSSQRLTGSAITADLDAQEALLTGLAYSSLGWQVRPVITGGTFVDYAVIDRIECGDVVDTQRRRRNQMTETKTSRSITY